MYGPEAVCKSVKLDIQRDLQRDLSSRVETPRNRRGWKGQRRSASLCPNPKTLNGLEKQRLQVGVVVA